MKEFLECSYLKRWPALAPLVLRLSVGVVFIAHGLPKLWSGPEQFAGFLDTLGVPFPGIMAIMVIAVEVFGGLALMLGLLTRVAAQLLAVDALMAWLLVHFGKGIFVISPAGEVEGGYELVLLLLAGSVSLALTGAGKLSLDHHIFRKSPVHENLQNRF